MKKLFLLSGVVALTFSAQAQQFVQEYIAQPGSHQLAENVTKWNNGETVVNGDENFYISRVKPKARFRNPATQVNESLTETNDKRLCFWVPLNVIEKHWDESAGADVIDLSPDTYPNGKFDSEVFSAWSYVDHFGNWNSPIGWIQGNFADVAHKNGVGVSGQASVPWGSLGSAWNAALTAQSNLDNTTLAQFLHYHGVDGLSYNSEWSGGSSFLPALRTQHADVIKYLESKGNMVAENIWYDGTNDTGGCTFDQGLGSHNDETFGNGENRRTSLFLNYNWHGALGNLTQSTVDRLAPGRSVKDLYAGFNMQGGNPYGYWSTLVSSELSIGMWGAHDLNYIWPSRIANGGADVTKQETYQDLLATFFTNGNHNPIDPLPVVNGMGHTDSEFFGMSTMMSARSSLSWDLATEPFISFFNLGNGQFFNWKGERQNDRPWYNIGVQDYMPTWRWWFANQFLGKAATNVVAKGLKAGFAFDDAYVGGSCLRIKGTSANEYLHLFKTKFALKTGDVITVRYKLVDGSADVKLALSVVGTEATSISENQFKIVEKTDLADDGVWETKTFTISRGLVASFNNKELAMVALHFENAENLNLYLGEFSIVRTEAATPATPVIDTQYTKILAGHPKGVDAKIIFNMPGAKAKPEPTYNIDVNTSLFKLYAQQEGGEEILMGITTSWAGMYYSIPTDWSGVEKMRLGVSAVSLDTQSESAIAWTDYLTIPATLYKIDETVQIDKTTITAGESFEISYVDPKHSLSTWKLKNAAGTVVAQAANTLVFSVPEGIDEIGAYDLYIDEGTTKARVLASYVLITPVSTGRLPEIHSLTVNNEAVEENGAAIELKQGDQVTLGYTGRAADGAVSRGVKLDEKCVGFKASDLGIGAYQSFAVAAWVNYESMPAGCNFFGVEDRCGDAWPNNNWGWLWGTHNGDGTFGWTFRSTSSTELQYTFPNTKLVANSWTHVVFVFEYSGNQFRSQVYVNGVKQQSTWTFGSQSGTTDGWSNCRLSLPSKDWLNFGGGRGNSPAVNNGIIDELIVWDGAITAAQVTDLYNGEVSKYLNSNIKGYWNFDTDAGSDHWFIGQGTVSSPKACVFDLVTGDGEGVATQTPVAPVYISGCPFIPGATFPVTTTPSWKANRGIVSEAQGTGEAGSAKLSYSRVGDFSVTLTLANSLGEAKATYPVFKVASTIEEIDEANLRAYTVEDALFVEFAEDGDYQVAVYNVSGVQVAHEAATVAAGQNMLITLGADGVYIVKVMKDGKLVRAIKVLKK